MVKIQVLVSILFLLFTNKASAQEMSKEAFLDRWESTETYVLGIISATPDSLLDFRPVDSVFTVKEQLTHIYNHLNFIYSGYLATDTEVEDWDLPDCNIECIKDKLTETFNKIAMHVKESDPAQLSEMHFFKPAQKALSGYEFLYLLLHHTTHHTGQLVVYLRLNGIAPPGYSGW